MNFNKHSNLEGCHAFLGASKHSWVNYDEDKLISTYESYLASERGTRLHNFAKECIELGIKLPRTKATLNAYVNDAIGFNMTPEQVLFYSNNCYGTADAISFKNGLLRIHDLKTGITPASMTQLHIYAAMFCLEYKMKPSDIEFECRIYQSDQVVVDNPTLEDIFPIMDKIVIFDKYIEEIKKEKGEYL